MNQVKSNPEASNPTRIWEQLNGEQQRGVISLMAQLVLKRVLRQIEASIPAEVCDEQNPG